MQAAEIHRLHADLYEEISNRFQDLIECYVTRSEQFQGYDMRMRFTVLPTYRRLTVAGILLFFERYILGPTVIGYLYAFFTMVIWYNERNVKNICHAINNGDTASIRKAFNGYTCQILFWRMSHALVLTFLVRMLFWFVGVQILEHNMWIVLRCLGGISTVVCVGGWIVDCYVEVTCDPYAWWFGGSFLEKYHRHELHERATHINNHVHFPPSKMDSILSLALIIPLENSIATLRNFMMTAVAYDVEEFSDEHVISLYGWSPVRIHDTFRVFLPSCDDLKNWNEEQLTGTKDPELYSALVMLQRADAYRYVSIQRLSEHYIYDLKVLDVPSSLELVTAILPNRNIKGRLCSSVGGTNIFHHKYKHCIRSILASMYLEGFLPLLMRFLSKDTMKYFAFALRDLPEGERYHCCFLDVQKYLVDWNVVASDESLSTELLDALSRHVVPGADFTFVWIGLRVVAYSLMYESRDRGFMTPFLGALLDYISGLSNDIPRQRQIGVWLMIYFSLIRNSHYCREKDEFRSRVVDVERRLRAAFPLTVTELSELSSEDRRTLAQYKLLVYEEALKSE